MLNHTFNGEWTNEMYYIWAFGSIIGPLAYQYEDNGL